MQGSARPSRHVRVATSESPRPSRCVLVASSESLRPSRCGRALGAVGEGDLSGGGHGPSAIISRWRHEHIRDVDLMSWWYHGDVMAISRRCRGDVTATWRLHGDVTTVSRRCHGTVGASRRYHLGDIITEISSRRYRGGRPAFRRCTLGSPSAKPSVHATDLCPFAVTALSRRCHGGVPAARHGVLLYKPCVCAADRWPPGREKSKAVKESERGRERGREKRREREGGREGQKGERERERESCDYGRWQP